MEKKPTSTLANISKSQLKNLNKVYQVEPIRDENRIDEIISIFIGGNLSSIKSILESNQIINFKDSIGQTLIQLIMVNTIIHNGTTYVLFLKESFLMF